MTSKPLAHSDADYTTASRLLGELRGQLALVARRLRRACEKNGEFDSGELDHHQLTCHELALAAADLAAVAAMLDYGGHCADDDEVIHGIALGFAAECCHTLLGRLRLRTRELGIGAGGIKLLTDKPQFRAFLDARLSSAHWDSLGERICRQRRERLPALLAEEIEIVRDSFRRFAEAAVLPEAEAIHRQNLDIPERIIKAAAELGCFGACIPERFGGMQPDGKPDSLAMIVVTEELSRGSLGAAGSLVTRPEIAARALLAGGTEAQQRHWLPKLASGEKLCAISITEPDAGSDVAAVSLAARKVENGWRLNGAKTWCTFAGRSELLVVLARTNPDAASGHRGLSLLLVDKPAFSGHEFRHDQEGGGSLAGKAIATLGYRGMHSFDLFFTDYFVPNANLVGETPGKGFYQTMAGFAGGRIQTAARASGVMQAAFEQALAWAGERKVFGRNLADFQLSRVKLARMLARLTAARQFSYAVARQLDAGGGQMEASLVKLFSCRAAEWLTREAMQLHGGLGYAEESMVSRLWVDARVLSIFEGSEETLALKVIARQLVAEA